MSFLKDANIRMVFGPRLLGLHVDRWTERRLGVRMIHSLFCEVTKSILIPLRLLPLFRIVFRRKSLQVRIGGGIGWSLEESEINELMSFFKAVRTFVNFESLT
jgi:hypothetical protein